MKDVIAGFIDRNSKSDTRIIIKTDVSIAKKYLYEFRLQYLYNY